MNETESAFCHILNCDRLSLYLNQDSLLDRDKSLRLASALKRRILGEPVQYILARAEFMGLTFKVTPDVFIPRPETEILVEATLKIAAGYKTQNAAAGLKILELGTGSGCIAVSLAKSLPAADITAIDISSKAIEIAGHNAAVNNVKINFLVSDLFSNCRPPAAGYGLIVANPPYIPVEEVDTLQREMKYEPRIALEAGKDGLHFYRRIVKEAADYLAQGGFLIMEIGFNQKEALKYIFRKCPEFEIIEVLKDYNDIERVIVAKRISNYG